MKPPLLPPPVLVWHPTHQQATAVSDSSKKPKAKEIIMGMLKEFKEFAMRGNVVDLAVGVIIGAAFGKIVTSMVSDILMPPIGKAMGGVNFSDLFVNLDSRPRDPFAVT